MCSRLKCTIILLLSLLLPIVEEEQARERYLKRFGDRPDNDKHTPHNERLLSPGPELTLPVPPPSPEPEAQINREEEIRQEMERVEVVNLIVLP